MSFTEVNAMFLTVVEIHQTMSFWQMVLLSTVNMMQTSTIVMIWGFPMISMIILNISKKWVGYTSNSRPLFSEYCAGNGQFYSSSGSFCSARETALGKRIDLPKEVLPDRENERMLEAIALSTSKLRDWSTRSLANRLTHDR